MKIFYFRKAKRLESSMIFSPTDKICYLWIVMFVYQFEFNKYFPKRFSQPYYSILLDKFGSNKAKNGKRSWISLNFRCARFVTLHIKVTYIRYENKIIFTSLDNLGYY